MKAEFLRHEYTWSNHGITGNVLGWGITASSCPEDKELLREMEKSASGTEPDRSGGTMVEEVFYHPRYGFVKMCVIPWAAGEDGRQNKKVYIYQPVKGKKAAPRVYLAPTGTWDDGQGAKTLSTASFDELDGTAGEILMKYHVYDRLPDFLRVVFWCILGKGEGLNIVAPAWEEEAFAVRSGELMYAIHSLLPETLRQRAGYISFTAQRETREPIYFSKNSCGKPCLNLDTFREETPFSMESALEEYFYYHLAALYVTDQVLYEQFMEEADRYLSGNISSGNIEKKLEWLFYGFLQSRGGNSLPKAELLSGLPELFYWAAREPELAAVEKQILRKIHGESWSKKEKESYFRCLLEGMTKRGQKTVCQELDWILQESFEKEKKDFEEKLLLVSERKQVYGLLLSMEKETEKSWQEDVFRKQSTSFPKLSRYVTWLEPVGISETRKDAVVTAGIRLLNKNVFSKKSYENMETLLLSIGRKEQWVEILTEALRQLEPRAENFGDEELLTACYVEKKLEEVSPGAAEGLLQAEYEKRQEKALPDIVEEPEPVMEKEPEEEGVFAESLLVGYPQGFLTGCVWYLSNYSLAIGHWKIAVGAVGMWALFMLNYYYMLLHKEKRYPFWKNLGLCLLEGYVIQFVASLVWMKKIQLYFFIVLGIAAAGVQLFNIIRAAGNEREKV